MRIVKECPECGRTIDYDTKFDSYGDDSSIVHIRTRRKTHILLHRECFNKVGASGAIAYSLIEE